MALLSLKIGPTGYKKAVITVSKKVSKLAVTRNTLRRRIRAVLRELPHLSEDQISIMARPGAEKLQGRDLRLELEKMLEKAKIY